MIGLFRSIRGLAAIAALFERNFVSDQAAGI